MKQSYLSLQFLVAGLLAAQTGCVDGGATIHILRNQEPGPGCVVPTTVGGNFLGRGKIDVNATEGYIFTPLIENRATAVQSARRVVFLDGANVDLEFADSDLYSEGELAGLRDQGLSYFVQPFSGSIAAGGLAGIPFEVIPKGMLDSLAGKLGDQESTQVFAEVELVGTLDSGDVSSNVFSYPITVCNGCLTNNLGSCSALPEGHVIQTGGTCQTLQDGVLDCCSNEDGSLSCPAVASTISNL